MQDSIGSFSAIRGMPRVEQYQPHRNRKGWRYADPFVQGGNNIPYATPEATTNNGASRLSMINAAITIIYRPKTMFHGVSTPMAGQPGRSHSVSRPALHTRLESAVSTFSPFLPLFPTPPPRDTAGFMQKSRNVSVGCRYAPN